MANNFHTLNVKEVRKETDTCVSVVFDVPTNLTSAFEFLPGQYLTLAAGIFGEPVRRAYSLCSSPLEGEWRVAIKKVPEGKFSTFANEALMAGDQIQVMEPQGNFVAKLNAKNANHYVGFAAGSGITPVLSILKNALTAEPNSSFTLIYGNKGLSDVIFFEELEALKNKFLGRLTIHHIFSREVLDTPLNNGRIDLAKLEELTTGLIDFSKVADVFICGPLGMTEMLRDELPKKGLDKKNIHFELFNTSDVGDKKTVESKISEEDQGKTAKVSITLDGKKIEFPLAYAGENVLDAALKKGADLPFACKGGVCSTCRAKLVSGQVDMEINYALEQEEVDAGFILTCQSHPRSENIDIDFDQK